MIQHSYAVHLDGRGNEDVIDVPPRPPAREGVQTMRRLAQVGTGEEPLHLLALGTAIEVAHENHMWFVGDHSRGRRELSCARAPAERKVHDENRQRRFARAKARTQRAAPGNHTGQPHFGDFVRTETTEQTQAVLTQMAEVAISLVVPVRKIGACREIFRLVDEGTPEATGVGFLDADEVELGSERGNTIERIEALGAGKHVLPTVRQIVTIFARRNSGLNVEAQQSHAALPAQRSVFCGGGKGRADHRFAKIVRLSWVFHLKRSATFRVGKARFLNVVNGATRCESEYWHRYYRVGCTLTIRARRHCLTCRRSSS